MYKIVEDYLTPNKFSRPEKKLKSVKGVVVHWVANAKTSARANRNFFEMRKNGDQGFGSAHYIIDLDGLVILAIPPEEMAYHVGARKYKDKAVQNLSIYPNNCTIGIECTHLDNMGIMSKHTYETLVELVADLMKRYALNPAKDLYRHYDITGKDCHKWFVDNNDEWQRFKELVKTKMNCQISYLEEM